MPRVTSAETTTTACRSYFELLGGGTLVLELASGSLTGEFAGGPDVPVRYGLLDLTRKS
jgi:hypothetical protein